jgi:hypothetical protein
MEAVRTMPDIEAVCIKALVAQGIRAYSSKPASGAYPLVTVQRTGGIPAVFQFLDAAVIDFNVWADASKADARDLADEVRQVVYSMINTTNVEWECTVTSVEDTLGLTYQPDPQTSQGRYVFALRVYAYTPLEVKDAATLGSGTLGGGSLGTPA